MFPSGQRPTRPLPLRARVKPSGLENDIVENVRAPETTLTRPERIPTEANLDQALSERRRLLFKQARVRDMGQR
jgi:hypothetical protein